MKNSSCIKNGFLTLTLIFSFFNLFAQEGYFEQGYGNDKKECGYGIIIKDNFRVAMAGYQEVTLGGQKDFFLCMTDSLGDTLLTKRYGGSSNEEAYSLLHTSDNGYLLTGYTESYGAGSKDAYLVKTDSNGVVEWTRTIGSSDEEVAYSAIEMLGTGFMVTGYRKYSNGKTDILVAMVDQVGAISWNTNYGGNDSEVGYDLKEKSSSSFIVIGTDNSTTPSTSFILEINASGTQQSYLQLYTTKPLNIKALDFDRSQGYLVAGTVEQSNGKTDAYFAKVNVLGTIEQSREYGGGGNDGFNDIKRLGGAIALLGFTGSYGEGESDLWIAFTDSIGDTIRTITAGGIGDDVGYAMYHNRGRIYTTGYNDSYGIEETGNMYEARFEIFGIGTLASHGEQMPLFYSEAIDCSMKRVMYVAMMYSGNTDLKVVTWQTSENAVIPASDFNTNSAYKGIIGNDARETQLLEFSKQHGFNILLFYDAGYLFSSTSANENNTMKVSGTGFSTNPSVSEYLKWRLNRFIYRAKKDYDILEVGIIGGDYRNPTDNPNHPFNSYIKFIFKNVSDFNFFMATSTKYNYQNTGKISEFALEHEFWHYFNPDLVPDVNERTFAIQFDYHKTYLKRMLNLKVMDMNVRYVDDYIKHFTDVINDLSNGSPDFSPTNTNIKVRANELVNIQDDYMKGFFVDRFLMVYYTVCRYPNPPDEQSKVTICNQSNTFFNIGGGSNSQPFQRDDYAYRTAVLGDRVGGKETNIYPLFSGEAVCINDIGGEAFEDNFLGFWLGTRNPNSQNEQRGLVDAEDLFMNGYLSNPYINHSDNGANKKFNGFTYFTYDYMRKISEHNDLSYNSDASYANNFGPRRVTSRIPQASYPNLNSNPCTRYIPVFVPKGKALNTSKLKSDSEVGILAYPNPTTGILTIELKNPLNCSKFECELTDCQGNVVSKFDIPEGGFNKFSFDIKALKKGLYFVKVACNSTVMGYTKVMLW